VTTSDPTKRLAFALDVADRESALRLVQLLSGQVGCFKVGLELFTREGPDIIFLDLKLHDIPATVKGALSAALALGVRYITVHAGGGRAMLETAREFSGLRVLAVTLLTSLGENDLAAIGFQPGTRTRDLVLKRAALAKQAGLSGVVCSGEELALVKEELGADFLAVVPGIRPAWSAGNQDQSRIITPAPAVAAGADLIVVGRPIRDAKDPQAAAARILEEMAAPRN